MPIVLWLENYRHDFCILVFHLRLTDLLSNNVSSWHPLLLNENRNQNHDLFRSKLKRKNLNPFPMISIDCEWAIWKSKFWLMMSSLNKFLFMILFILNFICFINIIYILLFYIDSSCTHKRQIDINQVKKREHWDIRLHSFFLSVFFFSSTIIMTIKSL